jgi:hypothetical protein
MVGLRGYERPLLQMGWLKNVQRFSAETSPSHKHIDACTSQFVSV